MIKMQLKTTKKNVTSVKSKGPKITKLTVAKPKLTVENVYDAPEIGEYISSAQNTRLRNWFGDGEGNLYPDDFTGMTYYEAAVNIDKEKKMVNEWLHLVFACLENKKYEIIY